LIIVDDGWFVGHCDMAGGDTSGIVHLIIYSNEFVPERGRFAGGGGAGPAGFLAYLVRKRDSRVGVRSNAKLRNSFVSAAITGRQNY